MLNLFMVAVFLGFDFLLAVVKFTEFKSLRGQPQESFKEHQFGGGKV